MLGALTDVQLRDACGEDPGPVCRWVARRTDSLAAARISDFALERPVQILIVVMVAFIASRVGRRLISQIVRRVASRSVQGFNALEEGRNRLMADERPTADVDGEPAVDTDPYTGADRGGRLQLRIDTMATVVGSIVSALVWTIAGVVILGQFEISLAPLFAGAGVVGVALGFGAQSVVADFLSGFFMLFEDQYGVGDVIDVGEATGVVEKFSLRTTTLRDVNGTLWHVPNSEIRRVGNLSQLWSRAVLDIEVAYDTDLRRAEGIIQRVADDLWRDTEFTAGDIIDPPEVWGIERLGADGVAIRLVVKTDPAEQWIIGRELRLRIKEAFDEADIEIPFPQRTVWLRHDDTVPRSSRPAVDTAPLRVPEASEDMVDNPGT